MTSPMTEYEKKMWGHRWKKFSSGESVCKDCGFFDIRAIGQRLSGRSEAVYEVCPARTLSALRKANARDGEVLVSLTKAQWKLVSENLGMTADLVRGEGRGSNKRREAFEVAEATIAQAAGDVL